MRKPLFNKRILITDYYSKDRELFEYIIQKLIGEEAFVIAFLNPTTFTKSNLIKQYLQTKKFIPILLRNINDEVAQSNICNLPKIHHVINFDGLEFIGIFKENSERRNYRTVDTEVGRVKPKLVDSTLFPPEEHVLINVVPDVTAGARILKSVGLLRRSNHTERDNGSLQNSQDDEVEQNFSRLSILRHTLSLRVVNYVSRILRYNRSPPTVKKKKEELRNQQTKTIQKRLAKAIEHSFQKHEQRRQKRIKIQEKLENNLGKTIRKKKPERVEPFQQGTIAPLSQNMKEQIEASRQRVEERKSVRRKKFKFESHGKNLEKIFQKDLDELADIWCQNLLNKQTKILCAIAKSFAEKMKALEVVFQK